MNFGKMHRRAVQYCCDDAGVVIHIDNNSKMTLSEPAKNLLRTVLRTDVSRVNELLSDKSHWNPTELGRILWCALQFQELEMATMLVEAGADFNVRNPFDDGADASFLHEVITRHDNSESQRLALKTIEHGARVKRLLADYHGRPRAVRLVELLVKRELKKKMKNNGSILQAAIDIENLDIIRLLIKNGCNVNNPAKDGEQPLYTASNLRQATITKLLVQAGANVNAPSTNSAHYTGYAIHAACGNNSVENICLLLRHGADVNLTDSRGRTPFSLMGLDGHVNHAHRMIIKHLAVSVSREKFVHESDLRMIHIRPKILAYYKLCLEELNRMKGMTIVNGISLFCIVEKSLGELSFLARNLNFAEGYAASRRSEKFPIFREDMDATFKGAEKRRKLLREREEALCESLRCHVPLVPLERIVYFLYMSAVV